MFGEFFGAPARASTRAWAWAGLALFVAHQLYRVWLKRATNAWYEQFYDALSGAEAASGEVASGEVGAPCDATRARVARALADYLRIAAPAFVVHPVGALCRQLWVLEWRRALVDSYVARWRHATSSSTSGKARGVEGASQRIHEDTQRFAAGLQGCFATLLEAALTLGVFCPVLYAAAPSLMWIALGTAFGGLGVSACVGRRLVGLEVNNQRVEAALRRSLVLLEVGDDALGDAEHEGDVAPIVVALVANYRALYRNFASMNVWLTAFDRLTLLLPYALIAPLVCAADPHDALSVGAVMRVANAFANVFESLNVISDNYLDLNEWRSVFVRLREFEAAVPVATAGARSASWRRALDA